MHDQVISALSMVASLDALWVILLAVPIGLVVGILPGLGGLSGLALVIPLIYGMEPFQGLAFLVALHAVVYTGGSVSAILLGIPGAAANAATVADGFALSRQGRAGYAIGAALTASAVGGLIGVVVLVFLLPVLRPVVEAFGSPETFFLSLLGIVLIGAVNEGQPIKGLIAGGLGVFFACFGYQGITGVPRFWMGIDYLLDGFRLVPLGLGLFAVPEILSLLTTGRSIAADKAVVVGRGEVRAGMAAVWQSRSLVLRSSVIGVVVGIIPGIGGETAPFVAYAAGKHTSRRDEAFGGGAIDGVIAPESGNNAKEGGALVPTLSFGIPGSAAMSLLLGAFLILGLEPGPAFLKEHLDIGLGLAIVIALANVVAAVLMLAATRHLALVTRLHGHVLAPMLLVLVVLGAYAGHHQMMDVVFVFVFGALGFVMRERGFSRAALMLGFVLGGPLETYLHISLNAYGPLFFTRPISLALAALIVLGLVYPLVRGRRREAGDA